MGFIGEVGLNIELMNPWLILVYRMSEYAAARYLMTINGTITEKCDKEAQSRVISAIRLIEGGAAMLAAHIENHSSAILGAVIWIPLFI